MKTQDIHKTNITETTVLKSRNADMPGKNSTAAWKNVLIGGVPGILIGSLAAASVLPHDEGEVNTEEADVRADIMQEHDFTLGEIRESHSVNDEMSFKEAFAAARAEVGPGGAFVWHGQVYGTYRGDDAEWQEMNAEDRAAYSQQVLAQVHATPYTPAADEPDIVEVTDGDTAEMIGDADDEIDVHIVGADTADAMDNGSDVVVAAGQVGGTEAVFADTDGDGEIDLVLLDVDGLGAVESPDYSNDVDMGSLL
ncbi:MAG: hypothetical protein II047_06470 [Bacteroidales bacterium]|nr:hypothetical protein [Bacteroidales bacterium]